MNFLYLILAMSSSASLSIMSSLFGKRNAGIQNTSVLYSVIVTAAATLGWGCLFMMKPEANIRVIGYSVLYGGFYTVAMIGMFKAYQAGSTALTAFVKQLSLVCVAFWGFIFWKTPLTLTVAIGLVLIFGALYFCFKPDGATAAENSNFWKWLIYAMMLLCGNAGCSIVQKYQQMAFDGRYGNFFMFLAVGISFLSCVVFYFSGQGCSPRELVRYSAVFPVLGGFCSAALNLFILLLIASPMPESVIFPGIAVGGLMLTILFSTFVYREKLSTGRWIGLAIGALALVFLNLS